MKEKLFNLAMNEKMINLRGDLVPKHWLASDVWPNKWQRRRDYEAAVLELVSTLTDRWAAEYEKQGKRAPRGLAEKETARAFGVSVAGLRRMCNRFRQHIRNLNRLHARYSTKSI